MCTLSNINKMVQHMHVLLFLVPVGNSTQFRILRSYTLLLNLPTLTQFAHSYALLILLKTSQIWHYTLNMCLPSVTKTNKVLISTCSGCDTL